MRVIDLLALSQDHARNTPVQITTGGQPTNIATYETATVTEQERLILIGTPSGHPLKLWEFVVLLNQPALNRRYVYIQDGDRIRPAFGIARTANAIVIN